MSTPSLQGSLAHFYPTEVLQLLGLAHADGRLALERGTERADLFLERGRPVFARSNGQTVRAGQLLVHRGLLSAEDLEAALAAQQDHPGERLGAWLVARGAITHEQLEDAVRDTLRRIVYGVLLWRDGRFQFYPGERVADEDIQLDLDVDRLILEGLRHADQQARPA